MNHPTKMTRVAVTAVLLVSLVLSSCSSNDSPPAVSAEFTTAFAELEQTVAATELLIDKQKEAFDAALKAPENAFFNSLTATDQHVDRFDKARTKLNEAETLLGDARPLAVDFVETNRVKLEQSLESIRGILTEAQTLANHVNEWMANLRSAKTNPDKLKTDTGAVVALAGTKYEPLITQAETIKQQYPRQAETVTATMNDLTTQYDSMNSSLAGMSPLASGDFVKLATLSLAATATASALATQADEFAADLATLPSSMTITLLDIKMIFTVSMVRSSWDEAVDGGEEELVYPTKEVSVATGNVIAALGDNDVVAREIESDGKDLSVYIDPAAWSELGIGNSVDEIKAGASGSHNHFEIYVNNWDETACQQVRELVNGKPATTERPNPADLCAQYDTDADLANGIYWQEADSLRTDAIGMDIFAKAAGDFDDQAIETATPPGMVYVDDPSAGEWREDENGNSFWYYYGQYSFFNNLIGGPYPYHYRSEYNTWNSGYRSSGKAYYAPDSSGTPRYGANSPLVASRFPSSNYTRDGLAQATVRNSGAVARAGGPGGGGK